MRQINLAAFRSSRSRQRGQALILVTFCLIALLGFAGLTIDVGQLYYSYRELQTATNAAALAGATALPDTTATALATAYSAVSGAANTYPNLPNVTMAGGYPLLTCLASLTAQGIPCVAPANANAVVVREQVSVPLAFAKLFGMPSLTIKATATAAMRGSARAPYNVIVLADTTASMNSSDGGSNCNSTRIACALNGIQVLLSGLSPCGSSQSNCGSTTANSSGGGANVANAVDRVGLFTFPPVTTSTVANDYNCGGRGGPSITTAPYTTPFPSTSTYQIINFSSDYRSSDTATSLTASSDIVKAVGATNGTGCMQAKGGQGTYYAQSIYQAQAALVAEQALFPNTQNVLIVLGDGDSNASCSHSSGGVCMSGDMPGASTNSGVYISTQNECHQAITAAQAATAAGTRVYTVAYGAQASGCSTDSPAITPCSTMQQMATNSSTFFTDYTSAHNSSCISASRPTSSLNQIFTEIYGDLTVARLIPDPPDLP